MIPKQQKLVIPSSLSNIDGYEIYCNFDITMENLGASGIRGTAIYVKSGIVSYEVKIENTQHEYQVWVDIPLKDDEKLLCGCIYRSPTENMEETARSIKEIGNILIQASNRKPSHLLIAGDFNIKEIDWETEFVNNEQDHLVNFLNDFQSCFLYQHVRKPTRYRLGETSNLLDLIITNEEGMVPLIEHHPGLGKSDHDFLLFDLKCSGYISKNSTNYTNIKNILADTNWASILNGNLNDSYKT